MDTLLIEQVKRGDRIRRSRTGQESLEVLAIAPVGIYVGHRMHGMVTGAYFVRNLIGWERA